MAQDIKLVKNEDGIYDIPLNASGDDIDTVDGLETCIIVSLFTDARAGSGNVPNVLRRRGWCGNILTISENYELGSLLWLLEQARLNQLTLNMAEDKSRKALEHLITDGIADTITTSAEKVDEKSAKLTIILFKQSNEIARFATLWVSTKSMRLQ